MPLKTAYLLHSSDTHLKRFQTLISPYETRYHIEQVVHQELLDKAEKAGGLTDLIREEAILILTQLAKTGAKAILITCSTLGSIADKCPEIDGCKILRIDNLLAENALVSGEHLAVICAVETTLEPTRTLFDRTAKDLNRENVKIDIHYVPNAWENFKSGNFEQYAKAIAAYIMTNTGDADTIVLAQASMDKVPDFLVEFTPTVLSSPKLGIEYLIDVLE